MLLLVHFGENKISKERHRYLAVARSRTLNYIGPPSVGTAALLTAWKNATIPSANQTLPLAATEALMVDRPKFQEHARDNGIRN